MLTISYRLFLSLILMIGLTACALTNPWRATKYRHLKPAGLDKAATSWADSIRQTHVHAKHKDENALAARWTPPQMMFRAEAFAVRGVPNTLTHNGDYEHLTAMPEKLNSFFDGRPDYLDYIDRSEYSVMASVKARPENEGIFDLDILHRFKGFDLPDKISVTNADQGHFGRVSDALSHKVTNGQVCIFYLSPTYTQYRRAVPLESTMDDEHLLLEAFPRFCEQKSGRYTYTQMGQGEPVIFQSDILQLSPPIVKDTRRPRHLPRTNSIALRGEWDIVTFNDDRLSSPYGTISVNQTGTKLRLICAPNIHSGVIIDGKYTTQYNFTYIKQHVGNAAETCRDEPGDKFAKSLEMGTFYADRQTLWFEGPHISFIAERSDREPSKYGWNDWYKYLSIEACLLDHPNIGADNYAGFGWFGKAPNHRMKFALVGDAETYWKDCKPDYHLDVVTVDYSLPFLNAKLQDVKADIATYEDQYITGGWVEQQQNSIIVSIDPIWAKDNQTVIEALKQKHPYVKFREDLPFDEIILTAQ